jgi:hypothetical protein
VPDSSRVPAPGAGSRSGAVGVTLLPLAFLASSALFLHDVVFSGRAYLLRDVLTFFHPWQVAVRESVRAGTLPFWNHGTACGLPLLANLQSGTFYPVNWLYWFLPFDVALTAGMALHLALAGIFLRGFLRRAGLADPAAFLGGVLFAFGTWPLAHLEAPMKLGAAIWLPLAWSGTWEAMRDGRRRGLGLAGLAVAMSLLAGYPQITALAVSSLAVLAVFLAGEIAVTKELGLAERAKRLLALPVALALGGLVAGAQLAPAWEMTSLSGKTAPYPADVAMARSLPPKGLVGLVDPFFLGLPGVDRYWGGETVEFPYGAIYFGALGTVLLFASIPAFRSLRRTRRVRREDLAAPVEHEICARIVPPFLVMGALVGLFLALGRHGPLWGILHASVPGFARFRWPATADFLVVVHLAGLAAVGLASLRRDGARWRRASVAAIGLGTTLLVASVLARGPLGDAFRAVQLQGSPAYQHAAWETARIEWARALAVRGEIVLVAGTLGLALAARVPAAAAWGWTGLLLLDLFLAGRALGMPAAKGFYDRVPADVAALRDELAGRRIYTPRSADQLGNFLAGCRNPVAFEWAQRALLCNANVPAGIEQVQGCDPLSPRRHDAFVQVFDAPGTPHEIRERLFDLWDAARLVEIEGVRPLDVPSLEDASRGLAFNAHEPRLGRASLVSGWRTVAGGGQSVLAQLLAADHDPALVTLLEAPPDGELPDPGERAAAAGCEAVQCATAPNRIQAAWHVGEGGMLRVLESWAPGWRATVNGEPAPVYRADFLFLAVPVPAGSVSVELEYRPASFALGAAASAAGLLGLLGCFPGSRKRAVPQAARPATTRAAAARPPSSSGIRPPSGTLPRPPSSSDIPAAGSSARAAFRRSQVP